MSIYLVCTSADVKKYGLIEALLLQHMIMAASAPNQDEMPTGLTHVTIGWLCCDDWITRDQCLAALISLSGKKSIFFNLEDDIVMFKVL